MQIARADPRIAAAITATRVGDGSSRDVAVGERVGEPVVVELVGERVGLWVGSTGERVGRAVSPVSVGAREGDIVGLTDGDTVGAPVGDTVGESVGADVGFVV